MKFFFIILLSVLTCVLMYLFIFSGGNEKQYKHDKQRDSILSHSSTSRKTNKVSPERINESFNQFLSDTKRTSQWTQIIDNNRVVQLDEALYALKSNILPDLSELLDQYDWKFYKCAIPSTNDKPRIVLSLHFSFQPNYSGNLYSKQIESLRKWENVLFTDMQSILFPRPQFNDVILDNIIFENSPEYQFVNLRQSKIRMEGDQSGYIGYVFIGDELLIGNNLSCLLEAQELLYDTSS